MFYGACDLAVQNLLIKCLVLYRAGPIYSMKSLVLYRLGTPRALKRYVLRCLRLVLYRVGSREIAQITIYEAFGSVSGFQNHRKHSIRKVWEPFGPPESLKSLYA